MEVISKNVLSSGGSSGGGSGLPINPVLDFTSLIVPWADSRGYQNQSTATTPPSPLSRGPLWRLEAYSQCCRLDGSFMQSQSGDSVAQLRYRLENDLPPSNDINSTIKPSQVPPCIAWFQIGTNSISSGVAFGGEGQDGTIWGDILWCLKWLVSRGHRVIAVAEWPRGDTSADSGLLSADNQKLMHRVHQAYLNLRMKNVHVLDIWPRVIDPARTDCAPLPGYLNEDNLHEGPGMAEVCAQEGTRLMHGPMGLPRLKFVCGSNGDQYDAVLNPTGCLNTNPLLAQLGGGTLGANATGVCPAGYTLSASNGLTVEGSFVRVTLPDKSSRMAFRMTVGGKATANNASVSIRQTGMLGKLNIGDKVEAVGECLINGASAVNYSSPGLLIDTGTTATRGYAGLSITNDKAIPANLLPDVQYATPRSGVVPFATALPISLSLEAKPYFTKGAASPNDVTSGLVIDWLSLSLRKVF